MEMLNIAARAAQPMEINMKSQVVPLHNSLKCGYAIGVDMVRLL